MIRPPVHTWWRDASSARPTPSVPQCEPTAGSRCPPYGFASRPTTASSSPFTHRPTHCGSCTSARSVWIASPPAQPLSELPPAGVEHETPPIDHVVEASDHRLTSYRSGVKPAGAEMRDQFRGGVVSLRTWRASHSDEGTQMSALEPS